VAATLSEVVGRRIEYRPISPDEYREALLATGLPPADVQMLMEQQAYTTAGHNAAVSDHYRVLTGQQSTAFTIFASEHAARWQV
jgi:hypothetical protein